jgi:hypothetical protein
MVDVADETLSALCNLSFQFPAGGFELFRLDIIDQRQLYLQLLESLTQLSFQIALLGQGEHQAAYEDLPGIALSCHPPQGVKVNQPWTAQIEAYIGDPD